MTASIPFQPYETDDAWTGPAIAGSDRWIYRLSAEEVSELETALAHAEATGKPVAELTREDFPLPVTSRAVRAWMMELESGPGFTLVRGLPVERWSQAQAEIVYWGLGLYMGEAVPQNTDGDLIGHVRDVGADPNEYGVRLYKTRAEQDFHTDGADVIGLLCLKPARSGGVSRIVSSVAIVNEIGRRHPALVPTLFQPFPFDTQGQHGPDQRPWFEFPICHEADGRLRTFFIPWYIRESQVHEGVPLLTPEQTRCVELIEEIANDPAFHLDMDFAPGDIQLLKNASVLHKRTEYEDFEDPSEKRHLLRLWITARDFSAGDDLLRQGIQARDDAVASK